MLRARLCTEVRTASREERVQDSTEDQNGEKSLSILLFVIFNLLKSFPYMNTCRGEHCIHHQSCINHQSSIIVF